MVEQRDVRSVAIISPGDDGRLVGHVLGAPPSAPANASEVVRRLEDEGVGLLVVRCDAPRLGALLGSIASAFSADRLPLVAPVVGGRLTARVRALGGAKITADELLRRLERYAAGEPLPLRSVGTLRVEEKLGFLFGAAMAPGFAERVREDGAPSVVLVRTAASALIGGSYARRIFEKQRVQIEADGDLWPVDRFSLLLAGTISSIGLGFSPLHRADELPHAFHLLGFACPPGQLLSEAFALRLGRAPSPRRALDAVAATVELRADAPIRYVLDGEVYAGTSTLRLTAGPRLSILTW